MGLVHNLGFPRIGARRELKFALEAYWRGELDESGLLAIGRQLRQAHWAIQAEAGLAWVPVGDFAWYDQVLDMSALLGVVPVRFGDPGERVALDTYFRMARGQAPRGEPAAACDMTKWFDTNYHYLVPEFSAAQTFAICRATLFDEVEEAGALGYPVKPVLLGPLTYLWLGKAQDAALNKLDLLDRLLPVYGEILQRLHSQGVSWVQIDEPILALDLPAEWRAALESAYTRLKVPGLNKLLTVYFGPLRDNLQLVCRLPVEGLHLDAMRGRDEVQTVLSWLPNYKVLSLGVIDGRNVWRADLDALLEWLRPIQAQLGDRLWLAPSCSLLHVPVDLTFEKDLDAELRSWLAFAVQKLDELRCLQQALSLPADAYPSELQHALQAARAARHSRRQAARVHDPAVQARCTAISTDMLHRKSSYAQRQAVQQRGLKLPLLPTTTIGSFPQTKAIRETRRAYKRGELTGEAYQARMCEEIDAVIAEQERLGLDVLVHGEAERNDMVEYFGELLTGFAFTRHGWVQSYGSRCVKPPIIYGDVSRPQPMTVAWIAYAQSKTERPMKGMLTGPVTMLNWSFVRDDQSRAQTCRQLALALRDEVCDLEQAGIRIIQIDEAALREGLPLRQSDWQSYLDWAVECFRLAAAGVRDDTQIHTHMCYSEFNDIMPAIAAMDADVITIETSRSNMALLDAFETFAYPNGIGPGVYDIHSPNIPTAESMIKLLSRAMQDIPVERLWVNPDCGLKTRGWPEVRQALANMVNAAGFLRARLASVKHSPTQNASDFQI